MLAVALAILLSGCTRPIDVPFASEDPPAVPGALLPPRVDPTREPPVTPRYDGDVPDHRCFLTSAFTWPADEPFGIPNPSASALSDQSAWLNATITLTTESPNGTSVTMIGTPIASATRLAYRLALNDTDFITDLEYGRWYPWSVRVNVSSDDPDLDGMAAFEGGRSKLEGYLLRYRGRDDKIHAYLEGELLNDTVVAPRIPLSGGALYLNGRGICGG